MANERRRFFIEYDQTARDVQGSLHQFFVGNLQRWLSVLDETPVVSELVAALPNEGNIDEWCKRHVDNSGFIWPSTRKDRLGTQLSLFRMFANRKVDATDFGFQFIRSSNPNLNEALHRVIDQIYVPFIAELRRYVDQQWVSQQEVVIPATDRFVRIDHNSATYKSAVDAIKKVEAALEAANSVEPEDKEERLAELSAGRRLLQSVRVRVAAVTTVAGGALLWLVQHFADNALVPREECGFQVGLR